MFLRHSVKENIIFVAISLIAFTSEPAIVNSTEYNPVNFTDTLKLSRGNLTPSYPGGMYLSGDENCTLVQEEFGWDKEDCSNLDNIIFYYPNGSDTVLFGKPASIGFVKFDDWKESVTSDIDSLWESFSESAEKQGKKLGTPIKPIDWYVYPRLDKENTYLYYAILVDWGGDVQLNVKAALFDRKGYIPINIVPEDANISKSNLEYLVYETIKSYKSAPQESYFDFSEGDKIAAVGAVGVLATLLGVKYGKGIIATIIGISLLVLKKAWIVIFLIPLFIGKIFRKIFSRSK
jgi:uncharacterized membrane-anchored protein